MFKKKLRSEFKRRHTAYSDPLKEMTFFYVLDNFSMVPSYVLSK